MRVKIRDSLNFFSVSLRLCASVLCFWLLSACQPATPAPQAAVPSVMPKLLATVYISPTPNESEQQATRIAAPSSETPLPTDAPPTPTVYIGIFLGEAENLDDAPPPDAFALDAPELPVTPTAAALADCPTQPDERYGANWRAAEESVLVTLGCPVEDAVPYSGTAQIFERGVMYFNPDGAIWAISQGDPGRYWFAAQAPAVAQEDIPAPEGFRVPVLGFGAMWRGVPGVRDALGFARTDEQGATFVVQRLQGGSLLLDSSAGQVFILAGSPDSGAAYGPY